MHLHLEESKHSARVYKLFERRDMMGRVFWSVLYPQDRRRRVRNWKGPGRRRTMKRLRKKIPQVIALKQSGSFYVEIVVLEPRK